MLILAWTSKESLSTFRKTKVSCGSAGAARYKRVKGMETRLMTAAGGPPEGLIVPVEVVQQLTRMRYVMLSFLLLATIVSYVDRTNLGDCGGRS